MPPRDGFDSPAMPPWLLGPRWDSDRFRQPGWLLLPLRAFLGATFSYAGLQKLASHSYLDASSPTSVQAQMRQFRHTSPLGPLLALTAHHGVLVGVVIALGELAVGLGLLTGTWTRLTALGGMALSLTFLLTVSWATTPYYYGSDIVFLFAWTPFLLGGTGGVLSVDAWARHRAWLQLGYADEPRSLPAKARGELDRRTVLTAGRAVAFLAVLAGVTGGLTAAVGRLASSPRARRTAVPPSRPTSSTRHSPSKRRSSPPRQVPAANGPVIASTSQVPVGNGLRFDDPATGQPAWLVHPSANQYRAFSAVCTHAGCTVRLDSSADQFVCPCHGSSFSTTSGAVLSGPAPSALPSIPLQVANGEVHRSDTG